MARFECARDAVDVEVKIARADALQAAVLSCGDFERVDEVQAFFPPARPALIPRQLERLLSSRCSRSLWMERALEQGSSLDRSRFRYE